MSYGLMDPVEPFQQAAFYVDRILRSQKPEEIQVVAPTKYSTIVNLEDGEGARPHRPAGVSWSPPTK